MLKIHYQNHKITLPKNDLQSISLGYLRVIRHPIARRWILPVPGEDHEVF